MNRKNKGIMYGGAIAAVLVGGWLVWKKYKTYQSQAALDLTGIESEYLKAIRIDAIKIADYLDTMPGTGWLDKIFDLAAWNEEKEAMDIIIQHIEGGTFPLLAADYTYVTGGNDLETDIETLMNEDEQQRYYDAILHMQTLLAEAGFENADPLGTAGGELVTTTTGKGFINWIVRLFGGR